MSKKQTLYMETTEIPADRTAAEISMLLVQAGATQINLEYKDQKIVGMHFAYPVDGHTVPFCLPVRVDPVFRVLNGRRPPETWRQFNRQAMAAKDREQAERVAWRQLLRWIQAQIAMIDTGMVKTEEIFMPYIWSRSGRTLFEEFVRSGALLQLPAPEAEA